MMNWIRTHKFLASLPVLFGLGFLLEGLGIDLSYPFALYIVIGGTIVLIKWLRNRKYTKETHDAK